jgi:hypothetical protein
MPNEKKQEPGPCEALVQPCSQCVIWSTHVIFNDGAAQHTQHLTFDDKSQLERTMVFHMHRSN